MNIQPVKNPPRLRTNAPHAGSMENRGHGKNQATTLSSSQNLTYKFFYFLLDFIYWYVLA
jgi:hypothetical protein